MLKFEKLKKIQKERELFWRKKVVVKKKKKKVLKKKFNKTRAKKKLDSLFSRSVRVIGCEAEGKVSGVKCGGPIQCAHIENRANIRLRWDKSNVLAICFGHHFWFHHNPLQFVEFLLRYYKDRYDYVSEHRNEKVKFTEAMYTELLEQVQKV